MKKLSFFHTPLVQGAVRDEGTSRTYMDSIYPAIPDFELMNACVEAAEEEQIPAHVGMARSHDRDRKSVV